MQTKNVIKYILVLFIVSRLFLTLVGVTSRLYLHSSYDGWHEWEYSEILPLSIWGVWDTGWYLDIAHNGYSETLQSDLPKKVCCGQNNLGFFPLYPILMKLFGTLVGDVFISGIIISNIALIVSALLIFKLTVIHDGEAAAKRAVKYLFIFPTSFILSGVFSESLFLLLTLCVYFFTIKKHYTYSYLNAFFLGLTKPIGFLVVLPILVQDKVSELRKRITTVLAVTLGTLSYMLYTEIKFDDFWAYYNIQKNAWNNYLTNPVSTAVAVLENINPSLFIILIYALVWGIMIFYFKNKISKSYYYLCILLFVIFVFGGSQVLLSFPRYSVLIFPLYIIMARVARRLNVDNSLTIVNILVQTFFMMCWVNGALII